MERFQEQLFLQQFPWSTFPPVHQPFNPVQFGSDPVHDHDPYLLSHQPSPYGGFLFNRRSSSSSSTPALQFGDAIGQVAPQLGSAPFGLEAELGKMAAQEMMDAKAIAASKSHSEAERRRRERINSHLARLRSLLPSTTKTDKASLLAEVIHHVKELKRQTSLIAETSPVPAEVDELTLETSDDNGSFVIKASLCCEDRSDLLPDLIKTLKSLRLRTLKAEITTLGGRVRNVLFITSDEEEEEEYCLSSIQEALKGVMERRNGGGGGDQSSSSGTVKRQRINVNGIGNIGSC